MILVFCILYDKLWDVYVVVFELDSVFVVLYIDLYLIYEVILLQVFIELCECGLLLCWLDWIKVMMDYFILILLVSLDGRLFYVSVVFEVQVVMLVCNCGEYGIELFDMQLVNCGIVYVIVLEQGFIQLGMIIVCGDSYIFIYGVFGVLVFGIGISEVGYVLVIQCLLQCKVRMMVIIVDGILLQGVGVKDVVLYIIGVIGVNGGIGYVLEFCGSVIEVMDMEQCMMLCNMFIEVGVCVGMVVFDQVMFDWVVNILCGFKGVVFDVVVVVWMQLCSDLGVCFDVEVYIDVGDICLILIWGIYFGMVIVVDWFILVVNDVVDQKGLDYMQFQVGQMLVGMLVDVVFVGLCINGWLSDMCEVVYVLCGCCVVVGVCMLVVFGLEIVKCQVEVEGIYEVVCGVGVEWCELGCLMCIVMNGDFVVFGQLVVSISNCNFEGCQGLGLCMLLVLLMIVVWVVVNGWVFDLCDLYVVQEVV